MLFRSAEGLEHRLHRRDEAHGQQHEVGLELEFRTGDFLHLHAAIGALERLGSIPRLFGALLTPRAWFAVLRCLRPPSLVGVRLADLNQIPRAFVYGNLFVVSVYTIGLMAAIYAGACLSAGSAEEQELARAATLT